MAITGPQTPTGSAIRFTTVNGMGLRVLLKRGGVVLHIELTSNDLQDAISPEIGNLINLQWLDMGGNNLTSLPAEIGNLVNLQDLSLSENNLSSVLAEIGNLTNLQALGLSDNNLSSLPPEIGNFTAGQILG
jgi:hypothetical protein